MDTIKIPHRVVDLVKDNIVKYDFSKGGKLYYTVYFEDTKYTFPIDITDKEEVGDAIFHNTDRAILFMRYINKSIKALNGDEPEMMIRWERIEDLQSIREVGSDQ